MRNFSLLFQFLSLVEVIKVIRKIDAYFRKEMYPLVY